MALLDPVIYSKGKFLLPGVIDTAEPTNSTFHTKVPASWSHIRNTPGNSTIYVICKIIIQNDTFRRRSRTRTVQ